MMGNYLNGFDEKIKNTHPSDYIRYPLQSYLSASEWRNVEMAKEFGQFLKEENHFFSFPYFRQTLELWRIFFNSLKQAKKEHSVREILFATDYLPMNLFVVFFTSMEMFSKGIFSLLLWPFISKTNRSEMQQHLADAFIAYAQKLETVPFYDHNFEAVRIDLLQKYLACENKNWTDWLCCSFVSMELRLKKWLAKPLQAMFSASQTPGEAGPSEMLTLTPETTEVLVKARVYGNFHADLVQKEIEHRIIYRMSALAIPDHDIYTRQKPETSYSAVYARIKAPRYRQFKSIVEHLAKQNIHIRKIAGNDKVQIKCLVQAEDEDALAPKIERLSKTKHMKPLYQYSDSLHVNQRYCLFEVPVRNLHKTIQRIEKQDVEVNFIHNF